MLQTCKRSTISKAARRDPYLVVKEHTDKKDKGLINGVIEDSQRTIHNVRVEVEQKYVIHSISRPYISTDSPEPMEHNQSSACAKYWKRCAPTNCCLALIDKAPNTVPAYPDCQDGAHAQSISKATIYVEIRNASGVESICRTMKGHLNFLP